MVGRPAPSPRFDRKFIEDHKLVERYLEGKLPFKGARDLEAWCRAHPDYLNELKLSERSHNSLKLLEASGQPQDLGEPKPPWWKSVYLPIGLGLLAVVCLLAFWAVLGKYVLLRGQLEDARTLMTQGSLIQPATEREVAHQSGPRSRHRQGPDCGEPQRAPAPDVHVDMNYTTSWRNFACSSTSRTRAVR